MAQVSHSSGCWCGHRSAACFIVPPHILKHMVKNGVGRQRDRALHTLALSARIRGERQALGGLFAMAVAVTGTKRRSVYNANNTQKLPGALVRNEGDNPVGDVAVNEAYDGSGATYDFYNDIFNRNSIDNHGLRLVSTVHFDEGYDNAFWNGKQMVYGDGDGEVFNRFTVSLDVIGHELTHGVTENTAGLNYQDEPGALNESMSDCFGSMVKQWAMKQSARKADWLIGKELLRNLGPNRRALRDMENPGTAFKNDPMLGDDPQPADMDGYDNTNEDNGGVHINSGIPNRAFCLAAKALDGNSWETVGPVWYKTLTERLNQDSTFADCANATISVAVELSGSPSSKLVTAIADAWKTVKVIRTTAAVPALAAFEGRRNGAGPAKKNGGRSTPKRNRAGATA